MARPSSRRHGGSPRQSSRPRSCLDGHKRARAQRRSLRPACCASPPLAPESAGSSRRRQRHRQHAAAARTSPDPPPTRCEEPASPQPMPLRWRGVLCIHESRWRWQRWFSPVVARKVALGLPRPTDGRTPAVSSCRGSKRCYCLLCWHKVYLFKHGYLHNLECLGTTTIKFGAWELIRKALQCLRPLSSALAGSRVWIFESMRSGFSNREPKARMKHRGFHNLITSIASMGSGYACSRLMTIPM